MTTDDHVRRIAVFNEKNPAANVAVSHLGPRSGRAAVSTWGQLATSQVVVAVAEMSDGSFLVEQGERDRHAGRLYRGPLIMARARQRAESGQAGRGRRDPSDDRPSDGNRLPCRPERHQHPPRHHPQVRLHL
ncbi:thiosulfate oxidation carrier protein SoxY [Mesorhizobium sp. M0954]|uniref:thiosulfate oxidation carrier protein SoxY n=1 Tax=Mesorhizobium sp. M0954 TaxID=2957032 RepID=UPI00333C4DB8